MSANKEITLNLLQNTFADAHEISHESFDINSTRTDSNINYDKKIINLFNNKKLTKSAVLVPITFENNSANIILTYRSAKLKDHAGQISFPGGRIDKKDLSPIDTAIRETKEEIGIEKKYINILGNLDNYVTGTGFQILPIIANVIGGHDISINSKEVESVFKLPMSILMNKKNHDIQEKLYYNGEISYHYNFNVINYENHFIWGATASILLNLYEKLK
jgi:8-oxo-dGTP pyrophosphatase MutT (NUDIX family)